MKYAEFAALCKREFADGGGDVVALNLTGPSAAELTHDTLSNSDIPEPTELRLIGENSAWTFPPCFARAQMRLTNEELASVDGIGITRAPNPVTHSKVTISKDADRDTATVTRTVALG